MDKPQRKWLVRHAGDHGIYDNTDDELFDVVERGEGWPISIATNLDRDTARLIAAAPDLVEALRALVADREEVAKYSWKTWMGGEWHWNDEIWERNDPDEFKLIKAARAALSKALGEGQEDNG